VHAALLEEGHGCCGGEKAGVGGGNIANDIFCIVYYGQGGEAFIGHEDEGFGEGRIGAM